MLLYHGTSERVARKALTEGLWPRALSRAPSLWERTVPSNSQLVYLTASYPGYFAANAAEEGEKWAIIEVTVPSRLPGKARFMFMPSRGDRRWAARKAGRFSAGMMITVPRT